jgi:UDP-GlcNAc:undecaprenyl-phosphate GlcNAc-1-phosphate transferase
MILHLLCLPLLSFAIAWLATAAIKRVAVRVGFVDKPGTRKIHHQPKPLGGGVAIFLAVALPLVAGMVWVNFFPPADHINPALWSGARQQTPLALGLLGAMCLTHLLGLWDDRKAMGPFLKLFIQLGIIAALVIGMELLARQTPSLRLRVLTALDARLGLGPWPSLVLTILWICAITNAFNFLDNMDGLSAGVAAVCTVAFLVAALSIGQWFVAAALGLLLGALLGFLCFNFAPATIFMGDSGSLLIGLLLGVLTVRTTYLPPGTPWATGWYAVFAPVMVLALPLYDLMVVSVIRLRRGKSPFVGDTNHFSHRLVARGMSRRTAVLCIYLVTAGTSVAAIVLPHVAPAYAPFLFAQTLLVLGGVALLEQHPLPQNGLATDEHR